MNALVNLALAKQALAGHFRAHPLRFAAGMARYLSDLVRFSRMDANGEFASSGRILAPCLGDWSAENPVEPVYFFQNAWAARKVYEHRPERLVDIGSSAMFVGMLSQFVQVTEIDIRRYPVTLEGLDFLHGSLLELPFDDASLECVSSLCVIEHIGLGRYGDALDPLGSEKAFAELKRVVRPGGLLMFSVPVDREPRVYFNAHRAFDRDMVMRLLAGFDLLEECYQYGYALEQSYVPDNGFGTGLYLFRRQECGHD